MDAPGHNKSTGPITRLATGCTRVSLPAQLRILPGKAAVIAEIEEDWITPLDLRVEEIGGRIMRTWRSESEVAERADTHQD